MKHALAVLIALLFVPLTPLRAAPHLNILFFTADDMKICRRANPSRMGSLLQSSDSSGKKGFILDDAPVFSIC